MDDLDEDIRYQYGTWLVDFGLFNLEVIETRDGLSTVLHIAFEAGYLAAVNQFRNGVRQDNG